MKIGIISDTHDYLDEKLIKYFHACDEIWHAGDIGSLEVLDRLQAIKPVRAVYGNIDDRSIRQILKETLVFESGGLKILLTHIGGYPGRYYSNIKKLLIIEKPDIFVCGHSHILKIIPDKTLNLLHINPGAAGRYGIQQVRTIVMIEILDLMVKDIKVVEIQ